MTINPSDVNDPITQILAGEEINMANFTNTAGPNLIQREKNIHLQLQNSTITLSNTGRAIQDTNVQRE